MKKEDWISRLTIDDMPNTDMELVAHSCGIEVAARLLAELPGLSISVPKTGLRKVINRYIAEEYDGNNVKELALECSVSIRHVYNIINKKRSDV